MKRYDRAYFDRWYRDPRRRVTTPAHLARTVERVLAIAEHVLERRVRTVLDLGCGEGAWQPVLARLRPAARWWGVDASDYAVRRYGARRHIQRGRLEALDALALPRVFDLIVCADVLHYLSATEMQRTLAQLAARLDGMAFLEVLAAGDDFDGDHRGWTRRSAAVYARAFARAGLLPIGLSCWTTAAVARGMPMLERPATMALGASARTRRARGRGHASRG